MFFCGAGISIGRDPWSLPGFPDLTRFAFEKCNQPMSEGAPVEPAARDAFCREQYDKALEILETREGGRGRMRGVIVDRLSRMTGLEDPTKRVEQLARHRALLDLAEIRSSQSAAPIGYRLVTTNFDNRFHLAGLDLDLNEDGPRLRPPSHEKPCRLVHLHGRIGDHDRTHADLVLTTRDFGNAYLRHGWAARFVIEMFREFTVLFIGYSLSDPVMRYLMDVFATERGEQRQFRHAYALIPFDGGKPGDRECEEQLWKSKRVQPIPYHYSHHPDRHYGLLDDTLIGWAAEHRQGLAGRLKVAIDATTTKFQPGTDDTDPLNSLASVVWALDTPDGEVARRFADHEPSPHISWFEPIIHSLRRRPANEDTKEAGQNGTIADPVPVLGNSVADALANWVCKHLDEETLINWITQPSAHLFSELRNKLGYLLEYQENIPQEPFRRFWQLVLMADKHTAIEGARTHHNIMKIGEILSEELKPKLQGPTPSYRHLYNRLPGKPVSSATMVADLGRFEIAHAGDYAFKANELHKIVLQKKDKVSSLLIDDVDALTSILVEWVRMSALAELPIKRYSRLYLLRENRAGQHHRDRDIIIDLLMDGFSGLALARPEEAKAMAGRWLVLGKHADFTIFTRLWLWAAADFDMLDATTVVDLLVERPDLLWSHEYEPEALRFLRRRAGMARPRSQRRLGVTLMRRPPAFALPGGLSGGNLDQHIDDARSLRLWKMTLGGVSVPGGAAQLLTTVRKEWHERGTVEDAREIEQPIDPAELARFMAEPNAQLSMGKPTEEIVAAIQGCAGDWERARLAERIIVNEPNRAVEILQGMRAGHLDTRPPYSGIFWGLRSLAEKAHETAYLLEPIVIALTADPALAKLCLAGIGGWLGHLHAQPSMDGASTSNFWQLWDLLLACEDDFVAPEQDDERPYDTALNSAGGELTEVLLKDEGRLGGSVGRGLSNHHRPRFDQLVIAPGAVGIYGRVMLVMQLHWLHAIDPEWTEHKLLPRFAWAWPDRNETIRFWQTFASFPRSGPTLFAKLVPAFIEALHYAQNLGQETSGALHRLFGAVIIETPSMFNHDQTIEILRMIGAEGCERVLRVFQHKLRDVGQDAPILWRERIAPWLEEQWPIDHELRAGQIARKAIEVIFNAREAFPEALLIIDKQFVIDEIDDNQMWLFKLHYKIDKKNYDYVKEHTVELAKLICAAISRKPTDFAAHDMNQILDRIQALPDGRIPEEWRPLFSRYRTEPQASPPTPRSVPRCNP